MVNNTAHQNMLNSPVRRLGMKVSLFDGDAFIQSFTQNDALKSAKIERLGESKFFGFGICHKANIKLIDTKRELDISTDNSFTIEHCVGDDCFSLYPIFYVSEVRRDENTNELSITAYDVLYTASGKLVNELDVFGNGYTLEQFGKSCAKLLGLVFTLDSSVDSTVFALGYPTGANFEGTESIRGALNDLAEATQTLYYISGQKLIFKRLVKSPVGTIAKEDYFTLDNRANRRLTTIASVTELGDNTQATTGLSGTTQYVRDNAFWELRDDIKVFLDDAINAVGNLTICQINCSWRGNYLFELGDCIGISSKDDTVVTTYLINDTIEFNGGLIENTSWKYEDTEETASNPSSLGDALQQTFAKVDKANKQIRLVVKDVKENTDKINGAREQMSSIQTNVASITNSVSDIETKTIPNLQKGYDDQIQKISKQVSQKITAEDMKVEVAKQISNGVDRVETSTGFTFNADGLKVSKSDSDLSTKITENGMYITRNQGIVLTANDGGVDAKNLHATTYLIIGDNSRFEDFADRTACFWIGG